MTQNNNIINEEILNVCNEICLIDENGSNMGKISTQKAIEMAQSSDLDLVLVAANANPPVCKIMDYGKFKFDQAKRIKEQKKNQKTISTKEIQLSFRIDKHDLQTKIKNARNFLQNGNNVYIVMRLRGRENALSEQGIKILNDFYIACEDIAKILKPIAVQGNQISMTLTVSTNKTNNKGE